METMTPRTRRKAGLLKGAKKLLKGDSTPKRIKSLVPNERQREPPDALERAQSESALKADIVATPKSKKGGRKKMRKLKASLGIGHETPKKLKPLNDDPSKWHESGLPMSFSPVDIESPRSPQTSSDESSGSECFIDEKSPIESESVKAKKKKKQSSDRGLTPKGHKKSEGSSFLLEEMMKAPPLTEVREKEGSSRKNRTAGDGDTKPRKGKKKTAGDESDENEDEDAKSRMSASSKKSKGSKKVKKGKKKLTSPKGRVLKGVDPDTANGDVSSTSGRSPRAGKDGEGSERRSTRAGKRTVGNSIGDLPMVSNNQDVRSEVSEISMGTDDADIVDFDELPEGSTEENLDLAKEVRRLRKKITELNEENMKAQFNSQSELARMRKELREDRLELQRSQTDRRELRAELRDRDNIIDESDKRIQALEKAVESQLDKVDDLEEELQRANEEMFDMEERLEEMEQTLAESSAIESKGREKEKDFGEHRLERMEKRLEERERELLEREKRLREERDALLQQSQPQRQIEKLEADNRMLLRAISRDKAEAAEKMREKEDELTDMRKQLKAARLRSYSQMMPGKTDENVSKLLKEKVALQQKLDEANEEASLSLREKQEEIDILKNRLEQLRDGDANDASSDGMAEELERAKAEAAAMRSKYEAAQRRNQLLEDDIDHWKSVNCTLEDELDELKSHAADLRSRPEHSEEEDYEDEDEFDPESPGELRYRVRRDAASLPPPRPARAPPQTASSGTGTRDEEDIKTTYSEPARGIANLWSKLTTTPPTKKRNTIKDMDSIQEVLARSTFH